VTTQPSDKLRTANRWRTQQSARACTEPRVVDLQGTYVTRQSCRQHPEPHDHVARDVTGDEKAVWWERAVGAYPPHAEYRAATTRVIPVLVARRADAWGQPASSAAESHGPIQEDSVGGSSQWASTRHQITRPQPAARGHSDQAGSAAPSGQDHGRLGWVRMPLQFNYASLIHEEGAVEPLGHVADHGL